MATTSTLIIVAVLVLLVIVLTIAIAKTVSLVEETVFGKTFCRKNPQYCQKVKYRHMIPSIPTQSFTADFKGYLFLTANVVEGLYEAMSETPKTEYYTPQNASNVQLIENKDYPALAIFCEMKKQAFLFIRGTNSVADAETDINYQQTKNSSGNLVHKGFYDLYMNVIKPQLDKSKVSWSKYDSIFIAGHSLGAATAIVAAAEIQAANKIPEPNLYCLAIAPPRAGSPEFASRQMNQNFVSLINLADIVPDLPLSIMSFLGEVFFYAHGGKILTFAHNYQDLQLNHSSYMYLDHFAPTPSSFAASPPPFVPSSTPSFAPFIP
jgi:hypothetical protein